MREGYVRLQVDSRLKEYLLLRVLPKSFLDIRARRVNDFGKNIYWFLYNL